MKKIFKNRSKTWNGLKSISSEKLAQVLVLSFILAGALLYAISFWGRHQQPNIFEFLENISLNLIGSAITFWMLEQLLDKKRQEEDEITKEKTTIDNLLADLGSAENDLSIRAVNKLRERGWLTDGTVRNTALILADLRGANLFKADLRSVDLRGSKLHNAILREAKLQGANLRGAELYNANLNNVEMDENTTLPDGKKYSKDIDIKLYTTPDSST